MILEISLVILAILCVASWYGLWNTMKKLEIMEDWISSFMTTIIEINNKVNEIDYKGYFAEDDETGTIFKQLKETINQLDKLQGEDING
tara:strand:- start:18743 stop:19009 length:267 start_codon:yes stop_codon:yes gene_type:complete